MGEGSYGLVCLSFVMVIFVMLVVVVVMEDV